MSSLGSREEDDGHVKKQSEVKVGSDMCQLHCGTEAHKSAALDSPAHADCRVGSRDFAY